MLRSLPALSRAALALVFLASTAGKMADPAATQQYMAACRMALAGLLMCGAVAFELAGGVSVLLGTRARVGAVLLAVFLVPATLVFHTDFGDQEQAIQFLENLAVLGGLGYVAAFGARPVSLDARAGRTDSLAGAPAIPAAR